MFSFPIVAFFAGWLTFAVALAPATVAHEGPSIAVVHAGSTPRAYEPRSGARRSPVRAHAHFHFMHHHFYGGQGSSGTPIGGWVILVVLALVLLPVFVVAGVLLTLFLALRRRRAAPPR